MISCEVCKSQLDLYIFEDETEINKQEIEAHLASCPACREEAELLLKMKKTLSTMPRIEVGPQFKAELNAKIDQMEPRLQVVPKKKRIFTDWRAYSALAACVMLAVVLKTNVFDVQQQKEQGVQIHTPQTVSEIVPEHIEGATTDQAPMTRQMPVDPHATAGDATESSEQQSFSGRARMMPEMATTQAPDIGEITTDFQDGKVYSPETCILYVGIGDAKKTLTLASRYGTFDGEWVEMTSAQADAFLEELKLQGVLYDASMLCGDPVKFQIQEKSFE